MNLNKQWNNPTPEDDQLLMRLKDEEGLSWNEIAGRFPKQSLDSVRTRYYWLKKRYWTPERNQLLKMLKQDQGLSWPKIATYFPEKNIRDLRTRFHQILVDEKSR